MVSTVILHNCFMFVLAMLTAFGPAYLAAGPFLEGFFREFFLFCDQKRKRKKSRCSEAANPGPGDPPPGNPKEEGQSTKRLKMQE